LLVKANRRMQTLRQHRWWVALTLVLALVFTMGAVPASALVCGTASESLLAVAKEGASCHSTQTSQSCCCSGEAGQSNSTDSPANWNGSHCGCTIEAPAPVPPADRATTRLFLQGDVASLPQPVLTVFLPTGPSRVLLTPVYLPQRTSHHRATPPRAPPAC
jgi:hypothetical protein